MPQVSDEGLEPRSDRPVYMCLTVSVSPLTLSTSQYGLQPPGYTQEKLVHSFGFLIISFLPSCLPACLPAFLPSFFPASQPSFLPSYLLSFTNSIMHMPMDTSRWRGGSMECRYNQTANPITEPFKHSRCPACSYKAK